MHEKSDSYSEKTIDALSKDAVVVKIAGEIELVSRVGDIYASVKRYGFPNVAILRVDGHSGKVEILVCDAKEETSEREIEDRLSTIIEILYEVHLLPQMKGNLTAHDFYSPFKDGVHELVKAQCNQEKSIVI